MSVTATISTPCSGTETLNQINTSLYQGSGGSFSLVVLASDPSQGWLMTVYDYSSTSSPCYPFVQYGQVTPNASDPAGSYGKMVNGSPDTSAGSASVV